MAKFKAGDMIDGKLRMSDGTRQRFCFMVNRSLVNVHGVEMYSLDDGNGFSAAMETTESIDKDFTLC
jgi:hypothetical protein